MGAKNSDAATLERMALSLEFEGERLEQLADVHVVLLGDSTLDNARYLDINRGELSIERQLAKRCVAKGWQLTVLAQDGSMLEDVLIRQVPFIPDSATHVILSVSGNDLLSLLNQMVIANFTAVSMYQAIVPGLKEVAEGYRNVLQALKVLGCHLACCTVYQPNFDHLFFKSLAALSLALHNSRLETIAAELDCSVIDLANVIDCGDDFANPLEMSTRGGSKFVENVAEFIGHNPPIAMRRYRHVAPIFQSDDDNFLPQFSRFGVPLRCCATHAPRARTYASKHVSDDLEQPDKKFAAAPNGKPLEFSEAQEYWRRA